MKTIVTTALAVAALACSATAEPNRSEELREFESLLLANGHWECVCICSSVRPILTAEANIPGKCGDDTDGSICRFTDEDGDTVRGTLELCYNEFVIDD